MYILQTVYTYHLCINLQTQALDVMLLFMIVDIIVQKGRKNNSYERNKWLGKSSSAITVK